jgi:hypothetical protein
MTTTPHPASPQAEVPGAVAQVRVILAEEPLARQSFRAGTAPKRPGVALVYAGADGRLVKLDRPLRFAEVLTGNYRRRYEVSITDYELELDFGHALPTLDDVFAFSARARVGFRVHDPEAIVRRATTDALRLVRWRLLDSARVISRKYAPEDRAGAEEEINKSLGSQPLVLDEGITIHRFTASISLDDETYSILSERRAMEREAYTVRQSSELQRAQIAENEYLDEQRVRSLQRVLGEGGQGLIALHLARHPDDTRAIIDLLIDRYDRDRQERIAVFAKLLEADLIQSADIEAIRGILRVNSLQALGLSSGQDDRPLDRIIPALGGPEEGDWQAARSGVGIEAYVDTEDYDTAEKVFHALDDMLEAVGLIIRPTDVDIVRGSFWKRAKAELQQGVESDEVRIRLMKIERAIELAQIDRRQAEVDVQEAGAVSQLLTSLSEVPQACVRVGSLLLIKYTEPSGPVVLSRSLSQPEIYALERFPEIQTKPHEVLSALASAVSMNETEDEL